MDQSQILNMQQANYERELQHKAQMADLEATFLRKSVKAAEVGMLTNVHKKRYGNQTGTVTRILTNGRVCFLEIAWADGTTTQSLPYMVTVVEGK
jgi:hypothetical protein